MRQARTRALPQCFVSPCGEDAPMPGQPRFHLCRRVNAAGFTIHCAVHMARMGVGAAAHRLSHSKLPVYHVNKNMAPYAPRKSEVTDAVGPACQYFERPERIDRGHALEDDHAGLQMLSFGALRFVSSVSLIEQWVVQRSDGCGSTSPLWTCARFRTSSRRCPHGRPARRRRRPPPVRR